MGLPLSTVRFLTVAKRTLNTQLPQLARLAREVELSSFTDVRAPTHTFNASQGTVRLVRSRRGNGDAKSVMWAPFGNPHCASEPAAAASANPRRPHPANRRSRVGELASAHQQSRRSSRDRALLVCVAVAIVRASQTDVVATAPVAAGF